MTGAAVAISMALLISMFSISEAIVESTEAPLLDSREDLVIQPDQGMIEGAHALASEISNWQEVDFATPVLYWDLPVLLPPPDGETEPRSKVVESFGIVPGHFWAMMGDKERERFDTDQWFLHPNDPHYADGTFNGTFTDEILLSKNLHKEGIEVGDTLPVGQRGSEVNMTVRGFFDHDFSGLGYFGELSIAIVHLAELQTLGGFAVAGSGNETTVVDLADGMSIALSTEAVREGAEGEVADRIREAYPEYAEDVFTKEDQLDILRQETRIAELFYIAVGWVSMFIGLLFVATIMIVSVLERTREIGMLRAIGISRRTIFVQIISESMVLVLAGALVGIAPGYYGASWAADRIGETIGVSIELGFSLPFVIQALFWVFIVGVVFAMYPAYIAVRMNIVHAITSAR